MLSRKLGDYSLVLDADDTLEFAPDLRLAPLMCDSYTLPIRYGMNSYNRVQLLRNERAWRYEGVVHEYPACDGTTTQGHVNAINYVIGRRGARRWVDGWEEEVFYSLIEAAKIRERLHQSFDIVRRESRKTRRRPSRPWPE
jgi:hypothetical protein